MAYSPLSSEVQQSNEVQIMLNLSRTEIFMCIIPGTIVGAIFNNCGGTRGLRDENKLSPLSPCFLTALSFFLCRHAKFLLRDDTIGRGIWGSNYLSLGFQQSLRVFSQKSFCCQRLQPRFVWVLSVS